MILFNQYYVFKFALEGALPSYVGQALNVSFGIILSLFVVHVFV